MRLTTGLTSEPDDGPARFCRSWFARRLFLPSLQSQRLRCGSRFRLLFASSAPATKHNPFPNCLHDKGFVVFWTALRNQFVNRALRRNALQQLLQMTFRIDVDRFFRQLRETFLRLRQNEFPSFLQAAVQINCADQRFKRIGQRGGARPAPARFLTPSHEKELSEIERGGMRFE